MGEETVQYVPFAEHQIQIAFRHFVRPGDTVYDAGANRGWLTKPLADLVGPGGHVVCFEPSPRNLRDLNQLIRVADLENTTVVEKALFHTSGAEVTLYENPFSNTDSLYIRDELGTPTTVSTITLDDYFLANPSAPSFVKSDIEGAEYDMLLGAHRLIERRRPVILLETRQSDPRPFELLRSQGYRVFNTMTFEAVDSHAAFAGGKSIEDLAYVPKEHPGTLYGREAQDQASQAPGLTGTSVWCGVDLSPGMNCVRIWGACPEYPYEPLTIQAVLNGRIAVSTVDQLILTFNPYYQCVLYASDHCQAQLHLSRPEHALSVDRIDIRCIPMTPDEHRLHEGLARSHPFGLAA